MEEKKIKITVRVTESQCNQLKREAEENSMKISDHIRGILFDKQSYFSKTIEKRGQELSQISPEVIAKVNQELIRIEHDLEQLRGAKKEQVAGLKERVDGIWQLLN